MPYVDTPVNQPVRIQFFKPNNQIDAEGHAIINHKATDPGFLQDIINTQNGLDDGWNKTHSIVVRSMGAGDNSTFYAVHQLVPNKDIKHLRKQLQ